MLIHGCVCTRPARFSLSYTTPYGINVDWMVPRAGKGPSHELQRQVKTYDPIPVAVCLRSGIRLDTDYD